MSPSWSSHAATSMQAMSGSTQSTTTFVLASVTSVPSRTESLGQMLPSLAVQSRLPDETVLVIPQQFQTWTQENSEMAANARSEDVEASVRRLIRLHSMLRLTLFRPTVDHGPIMKLVGALWHLRTLPNATQATAVIITLDDDVFYPSWLVERSMQWAALYPRAVIAQAGGSVPFFPKTADAWATVSQTLHSTPPLKARFGVTPGGGNSPLSISSMLRVAAPDAAMAIPSRQLIFLFPATHFRYHVSGKGTRADNPDLIQSNLQQRTKSIDASHDKHNMCGCHTHLLRR